MIKIIKISIDFKFVLLIASCFLVSSFTLAQPLIPKVGAYYFDGWNSRALHVTEDMKVNYSEREPTWGWVTSTQKIVDDQIDIAADRGLSFLSFCWYYFKDKDYQEIPLNQALGFYLTSVNVKRLEFCLLVANHAGYEVGPDDWNALKEIWVKEFKHPQYLKVDGKPIIIFFEYTSLVKKFGSTEQVSDAFEKLRQYALENGLSGVSIAICADSQESVRIAEACGADVITGYNYHSAGFSGNQQEIPIQQMQVAEQKLWSELTNVTSLKYIPVSTVGWDPRPWSNPTNKYSELPYYTGFSAGSVKNAVQAMIDWVRKNPQFTTKEQLALLYAWNENGEGAWLTPGKLGFDPSSGIREVLK